MTKNNYGHNQLFRGQIHVCRSYTVNSSIIIEQVIECMQLSVIQHNPYTLSGLNNPHAVLKVYMVIAHVVITL